ncbi:MAG TPA: hypothetical protein K8V15_02055 [Tessaracoccus flavescens]|uniref:Uncharacterized protein n=1 Tax=Tessaracoccus flavescens TaxID=399497 RepID=A0A921ENR5_9ACTN|nr:hypothetical protein [Tessaracoccus flavescens]
MIPWSPIPPETPLRELWGTSCYAEDAAGRALVASISLPPAAARRAPDVRLVTSYATFGLPRRRTEYLPDYLPISAACISLGLAPRRIVRIPDPTWPRFGPPQIPQGDGVLSFKELTDGGPPASTRLQGALAMADDVKATYGRMLADVAYRIEQSALFDSTVPTTRTFDNALAVWNDLGAEHASEDEVVRLAGALKLAFDTARAHAETVGLDHLPATARAEARRAAGAARLAVSATTDGERRAAQAQVIRLLKSLALHYLPTEEATRKALTH